MSKILYLAFALIWVFSDSAYALQTQEYPPVERLLELPEEEIDFALAVLLIEKRLHPELDISEGLENIESILTTLKRMPDFGDSSLERMGTVLRYFYTPSMWNNMKPYSYDFADPFARKSQVSTISQLMKTKRGNCISMPTLITVLGQRLGVEISLSVAPNHVFAHFKDGQGTVTNIEATSGRLLTNQRYVRAFNINSEAIENGVYLKTLSKKQAISVLMVEIAKARMRKGDFEKARSIASLALKHHPQLVEAMLVQGNSYYLELQRQLTRIRKSSIPITQDLKIKLDSLNQKNLDWFEKAELLGWREPPADSEQKYLDSLKLLEANN